MPPPWKSVPCASTVLPLERAVADLLEARPEFGSGKLAAAVVAAWQAPVIREAVAREADEARGPRRVAP